jgi:membrane protease subunit HflK
VSPWNKPGGNGQDQNPWGQGGRDQGPPDLDEIIKKIQQKLSGIFGGGGGSGGGGSSRSSGIGFGLVLILIVAVWLASGFYVVQQGQRGVVLQFGKKSEITKAGLHWHLPFPIETVMRVDVKKTYRVEIGYRGNSDNPVPSESLMLTKDENIVNLGFGIQYRIKNADEYLFNVRDVEDTIRQAAESSIREVAGNSTMDFLMGQGREQVAGQVHELLQSILDEYKTGILITEVRNQQAGPPEDVQAAFDDAVRAREDQQRYINDAQAYANKVTELAQGNVVRINQDAVAYRNQIEQHAKGDADRFRRIEIEYAKAPRVTRERMYLETVEKMLSNTTKVYVDQKAGNNLIYLPLDKLMSKADQQARSDLNTPSQKTNDKTQVPAAGQSSGDLGSRLPARRIGQ